MLCCHVCPRVRLALLSCGSFASLDRPFCEFSSFSVWHRWAALCHALCLRPVGPRAPEHAASAQPPPVRRESTGLHSAEQLLVLRAAHCVPTEAALPDKQRRFLPPPPCLFIHMYLHPAFYYSSPSAGAALGCKCHTGIARFIACFVSLIPSKVLGT